MEISIDNILKHAFLNDCLLSYHLMIFHSIQHVGELIEGGDGLLANFQDTVSKLLML